MRYGAHEVKRKNSKRKVFAVLLSLLMLSVAGYFAYNYFFASESVEEQIQARVTYDSTVTLPEQEFISDSISKQQLAINNDTAVSVNVDESLDNKQLFLEAFVPVANKYSIRQSITTTELTDSNLQFSSDLDPIVVGSIKNYLGFESTENDIYSAELSEIPEDTVVFIPSTEISPEVKLLTLNDNYYLDTLSSGAIFREAELSGEGAIDLSALNLKTPTDSDSIFKVNMTGVTALTREMQKKLAVVKDPLFFSANIGEFLSDADLTHVSNEVSFKENCAYSYTLFCSPPEFIETLKASGVDLVELTGNHNNDLGSEFNTATINQYRELGWATVGGGLNREDAAKPYITTKDGSTVAFIAYNYPDSPNGGAIAGTERAGANPFDFSFAQIEEDIKSAKSQSDFVIVNVQYWECYAYPDGYVEYPICDKPIGEQESVFKKIADLGADMVVGSSAHQPQTFEYYNGKPIFYGLGNLYFDQTNWPGTERGIIITNYFSEGEYIQTKLSPTVFNKDFQTRLMTPEESEYLLTRLSEARQ